MPRGDKSSRLGCPSSVFRTHFFDFICSWAAPQLLRRRRRRVVCRRHSLCLSLPLDLSSMFWQVSMSQTVAVLQEFLD